MPAALNRDITGTHAISQSTTKTSASVSWQVPTTGHKIQTPDLSPIVNEILALADPKYGSRRFGFIFESPATTEVQWTCNMNTEDSMIRSQCVDGTIVNHLRRRLQDGKDSTAEPIAHVESTERGRAMQTANVWEAPLRWLDVGKFSYVNTRKTECNSFKRAGVPLLSSESSDSGGVGVTLPAKGFYVAGDVNGELPDHIYRLSLLRL